MFYNTNSWLLEVEWSIPRPSYVAVIIFDKLFICYFKWLLYLEFRPSTTYFPLSGSLFFCLWLSSMLMKKLSSNKQLIKIYIASHNNLFPPRHLTCWVYYTFIHYILINICHVIIYVSCILLFVFNKAWIQLRLWIYLFNNVIIIERIQRNTFQW